MTIPKPPANLLPARASEVRPDPPFLPDSMSYTDRIRAWMEIVDANEAFVLAGLRRQIGPDGDLQQAYREWHERKSAEHSAALEHMCAEFNRRWAENG